MKYKFNSRKCLYLFLMLFLLINFSCSKNKVLPEANIVCGFENENLPDGMEVNYGIGIDGKGLEIGKIEGFEISALNDTALFSNSSDFSFSLWLNSESISKDTTIILSNADFDYKPAGIYGWRRKGKGFTLYSCNGGWGWNIGNGRLNYLYDPVSADQSVSDGLWHQLGFSYSANRKEVRLYYDGINKAIIKVGDLDDQDFISPKPLFLGSDNAISEKYKSFTGCVDELKIWDSTLEPGDFKTEYSVFKKAIEEPQLKGKEISVLNWNIWHGGTHFTLEKDGFDGIDKIVEMIRESDADIVLMQETYGAGSEISSKLGYYYYEAASTIGAVWGANLSVMSRYPMADAYMVEERSNYGNNYAFNNGGVRIILSKKKSIIAFSNWYNGRKPEDLEGALTAWKELINNADNIPIVYGGDFNSVSHLDDGKGESGHSKLMINAGFTDSYREMYPDTEKYPGYSGPGGYDRIDYIYYIGKGLELVDSATLIEGFKGRDAKHPGYPSDHLGFISKFKIN